METIPLLLALRTEYAFDRDVYVAIAKAAQSYGNFDLIPLHPEGRLEEMIAGRHPRGMVISRSRISDVEKVTSYRLPCVNVAGCIEGQSRIPVVTNDDAAIGRTVAEYYLDRGFKHFAYFAEPNLSYFNTRRDAFVNRVTAAGFECHIGPDQRYDPPGGLGPSFPQRVAKCLAKLERPLGVMCPYDGFAMGAVQACKLAGLRVPEEVSIIGVDNDPLLCLSSTPQVSSVKPAATRIGSTTLELLREMIKGKAAPAHPILLPPTSIVERGSTIEHAIYDPDVAAAVNYIRTHLRQRLTVSTVNDQVPTSRKTLERKFVKTLGRTPLEEIHLARLELAKRLLIETDLSLPEVARRSGLVRQQRLSNVFRTALGMTPSQFRAEFATGE